MRSENSHNLNPEIAKIKTITQIFKIVLYSLIDRLTHQYNLETLVQKGHL